MKGAGAGSKKDAKENDAKTVKNKKEKVKAAAPPKDLTGKKSEKTPAQLQADEDSKILKRQARALGVISHRSAGEDKEHCDISRLKISPLISKHSATKPVEILKRSTARKNKVIIMFPGLVSVVQEGKFGQLYDMDSNPKLDIDFPTGTLRMLGTHVHTKTKLMTLQPAKGGKRMQALDFFEHMVVFSQHEWLGSADADPMRGVSAATGADIPDAAFKVLHKDFSFNGGAATSHASQTGGSASRSIKDFFSPDAGVAGSATEGRSKRAAATKVKYREDGSDWSASDEEEEEEDSGTGTRSPVRLPIAIQELNATVQGAMSQKGKRAKQSLTKKSEYKADSDEMSEDHDDAVQLPAGRASSTPRRATASKTTSYTIKDSDESDEAEDDDDEDDAESESEKPKKRKTPPPKHAKPNPKKAVPKKRKNTDSDEDEEEEGDESEDEKSAKKKHKAKKPPAKSPAKKKPKKKKARDSEDEDESDESISDNDDDSDFAP